MRYCPGESLDDSAAAGPASEAASSKAGRTSEEAMICPGRRGARPDCATVRGAGSTPEEAGQVAANLVEANLRGHDSHGVGMVPRYIDAVQEGGLAVNAHVAIRADSGALLTLDGRHGYGQVIGAEAMALVIERAQRLGVCVVGLAHSHHLGRIGHWAEQCIAAGLVSIHFVNVLARPIFAPLGGALAGGATGGSLGDGRRRVLNSMFSILVDPGRLGTAANLAREMESFVAWITASPPASAPPSSSQ